MTTFNSAEDAYAAVDTEVQRRFEANPELRQAFAGMDDASRSEFKHQAISHISEGYRVATGRTRPVWDIHATPYSPSTEAPITRKLQSPAIEQRWSALHSGEIGLEDLSPEQAKELQTIAKDQEPELVEYLKTDPQYLRHYAKAIEDYKGVLESGDFKWTKDMAWNPVQRSLIAKEGESYTARDRGAVAEFGRKLIGSFADLGMAVPQWMERRKRVEFGNPEGLKPGEIRERADAAAFADLLPYYVGTRNLQDDADLTGWEKAGGAGGTLFSFFVGSPNKLAFDAGMKAGAKGAGALAASKLVTNPKTYDALTKGWQRRLMTYGAGGAALGAKNTLIDPAPANQSESLGEFAGRLAKTAGKDAAVGMAFGEALHYGLAGLGYAWAKTGAPSPFMRAAQKSSAQEFTNSFYRMARRVDEGTANKTERETFANFSKWAEQQGVDMSKLRKGELGVEMTRLIPREWTAAHPALREALPNSMTRMKPKRTDVPGQKRLDAETSSRHTGPIPEAPARPPMPQRTAGEIALPGEVARPIKPLSPSPITPVAQPPAPASSPVAQGATSTGARPGDQSQPSPTTQGSQSPDRPDVDGSQSLAKLQDEAQALSNNQLRLQATAANKRIKQIERQLQNANESTPVDALQREHAALFEKKNVFDEVRKARPPGKKIQPIASYSPQGRSDYITSALDQGPINYDPEQAPNFLNDLSPELKSFFKKGKGSDRVHEDNTDAIGKQIVEAEGQHQQAEAHKKLLEDALSARKAEQKELDEIEYMGKTDGAFYDNMGRSFGQTTGTPVKMAELQVGDSFEIRGEHFEIKQFLDDGRILIEDGREFVIEPELEVYVDRGHVEAAPHDPATQSAKDYVTEAAESGKSFDAKLLDEPGVKLPKRYQVRQGRAEPMTNKAKLDQQLSAKQAKIEKNIIIQSEKQVIAEEVAAGRLDPSDLPEDYFVQLYREQLGATNQELAKQGNTAELPADYYDAPKEVVSNDTKPEIVGYEWRTQKGEKFSAWDGGLVPAKVSDWDAAEVSELSGRKIVHVYWIKEPNGEVKPYGKTSALKRLGYKNPAKLEKTAQRLVNEAEARKRNRANEIESLSKRKVTAETPLEARKEWFEINTSSVTGQTPSAEQQARVSIWTKDGKYLALLEGPTRTPEMIQEAGFEPVSASKHRPKTNDLIPNDDFKLTNEDAADSAKALEAERAKRQQEQDQGKLFDTGDVRGMEGEAPAAKPEASMTRDEWLQTSNGQVALEKAREQVLREGIEQAEAFLKKKNQPADARRTMQAALEGYRNGRLQGWDEGRAEIIAGMQQPKQDELPAHFADDLQLGYAEMPDGTGYKIYNAPNKEEGFQVFTEKDGLRKRVSETLPTIEAAQQAAIDIASGRKAPIQLETNTVKSPKLEIDKPTLPKPKGRAVPDSEGGILGHSWDDIKRKQQGEAYVQQQTEGYNTNQGPLGEAPVAGENIPPKDDANYSELPIEMPEMVQLYRSLLGGKYPQIAKKLGNALGVFRHTDGPKGEGHVELLASIFKLITPQQEQELMKQAMAKAQAEMPDADLGDPAVSKLARDIYEQLLRKATDEAKTKPPVLGSKVLAHEIMHLVDWLPNKMIQGRGNLLGRIKSAKGYLKHHLNPWEIGPQNQLTNKDRQRLRKQAKDLAAIERDKARLKDYMEGRDNGGRPDVTPDEILQVWNSNASRDSDPQLYEYVARLTPVQKKELVKSAMRDKLPEWLNFQRRLKEQPQTITKSEKQFYHDLLKAEIEKRNLFWLEELKAEAESLIAWWHGQERMPDYFKTSVEMYAEMGNVLLNNPAAVRERAPKYYDAFMRYLDAKPEFAKNYREIQELMRTGNVQATRAKNIEDMLDRQEAWGHEADMNQRTKREHLNNLLRLFGREESAVLSYLDKGSPEIARAKMAMGNFRYRDSAVELMLRKVNEQVIRPLKEADLSLRDLSLYSLHQHVFHNRADIASTLGMNPKASAEQLDQLRKSMTDEQWQVLEQARQTWSAVRREQIIEPLMQAGVLKPETEQILLDRDFYVTFAKGLDAKPNRIAQNLDDLMQANYGRQVSSGIYQQHGYMGEIKDPVTATLQKDIALVRMAKREQAKKAVVREMLREGSPFIEEAKYTFDGKARVPIEVNGSRVGTIQLLDRGQRKAYYVPEAVASFFNSEDPLNDWMFNMITIPNRITKALFTQNNPGFVPVAFIRDVGAAIMQLPEARASDILPLIPSSMMDAARGFLGGDAPYTEQGLKRGVLISRATPKGEQMGLVPGSEALMLQFGINPRAGRNEKLPPAERFGKAWNMIFMPGQIAERTMKIVGMRYLDQKFPNMPEGEKQEMIREWAGSPDFLNRGARNALMESAVGLYYNAAREGARSSGKKVYKDPWSVGVNFLKYVAGPAGLMLAAEMGMFGKDLEEQMGAISEYDKTNYITVPMGWADKDQRKVRVLRLPLFEGWKWMHGASRKMAQTAIEQQAEPLGQLKEFAGDQIPIGNPFMDSMSALWTFYGSGGNPYDNFRNRPVIGEDEMLTGQGDDAQLWAHVWNNLGGGLVYRFNEPTLYAEETALESGLNKPFVQSTLGRFLKVTNQGWKEQIRDTSAPVEKQRAQDRMRVEEILREMYKAGRDEPTEKQWQWIEAEPYRIEHLKSKWRRTERMRDDFEYQLLNLAPSKDSKAAVLESGLLD